jgi:predicted secreted hydrolase
MKAFASIFIAVVFAAASFAAEWKTAQPGWRYEFPRDHYIHEDFKTEWWYFTGNIADESGRRFGYQLTLFRQGIRHPSERNGELSRFVVGDLKFAHFTVTDVARGEFVFDQKASRGAYGEAGFSDGERVAWNGSWTVRLDASGIWQISADNERAAINLRLESAKPPVIHGQDGISRKAAGAGHASHYYSLTRLTTSGELRVGRETFQVRGESWFDREWATSQLAAGQVGWDWLSVQLDDGTELMLYQMRLEDGGADPSSSGTFVDRDGAARHLTREAFRMTPTQFWNSRATAAKYPVGWRIEVPGEAIELTVKPVVADQELALKPLTYWEGAVEITGTRAGKSVRGRGYLELTGYAGALRELQR